MTAVPQPLSDAELIAAVRRGDTSAYGELYERHLAAANRAAAYLVSTTSEREDLVAEAFTRVLQVLRTGRGPVHDFRPYLLVTMRHAAINAARRGPATALFAELPDAYLAGTTDDPVDARLTGDEAASAFAGLPERWRKVLWHTEVEGASPAAIAPMLGMTPNGVAALAYRAREGLRQAYLRMHLPPVDQRDCRAATDKLAGWVRQSISEPQQRKITAHLRRCPRCRELAAGLRQVNGEMRVVEPSPIMSWLSVLKSALSATTVKVGTAAAIAAVTAVGVVASEPPATDRHPGAAGPGHAVPNVPVTSGGTAVQNDPALTPDGTPVAPDAPPGLATGQQPEPARAGGAANSPGATRAPETPANQGNAGNQGTAEEHRPAERPEPPARPEQPPRPENVGQAAGTAVQPEPLEEHGKK